MNSTRQTTSIFNIGIICDCGLNLKFKLQRLNLEENFTKLKKLFVKYNKATGH